jgi:hypothetical protein
MGLSRVDRMYLKAMANLVAEFSINRPVTHSRTLRIYVINCKYFVV